MMGALFAALRQLDQNPIRTAVELVAASGVPGAIVLDACQAIRGRKESGQTLETRAAPDPQRLFQDNSRTRSR